MPGEILSGALNRDSTLTVEMKLLYLMSVNQFALFIPTGAVNIASPQ